METKKHSSKDIYDKYNNVYNISLKEFRSICRTFNNILMKSIIDTGFSFKLPFKLGILNVKKFKTRGKKIDFGHYNSTGEIKFHENKHSDGFYAAFEWNTKLPYGNFTERQMYKFFPVRYWKKYLADSIRDKNTINKYFEYE